MKSSEIGSECGAPQDFGTFLGIIEQRQPFLWSVQEDFLRDVGFLELSEQWERSILVDF